MFAAILTYIGLVNNTLSKILSVYRTLLFFMVADLDIWMFFWAFSKVFLLFLCVSALVFGMQLKLTLMVLWLNNLLNIWRVRKCFFINFDFLSLTLNEWSNQQPFIVYFICYGWHLLTCRVILQSLPIARFSKAFWYISLHSLNMVLLDDKVEINFPIDVGICLRILGGWFDSL